MKLLGEKMAKLTTKKRIVPYVLTLKSKYETCPDCKLHIRANGKTAEERLENHKNGYHHKVKTGTLSKYKY